MPKAPKRPCRFPGCPNLCDEGVYCAKHKQKDAREQWRGSAAARGYDGRWQKARKAYLSAHPVCVECLKGGRVEAATVVDHIQPHRGDQRLFWDTNNWQALCKRCHDQKTARGL